MITFLQAAEVAATEEARMGLWELFTKGGWLMWPLLILGGEDFLHLVIQVVFLAPITKIFFSAFV